MENPIRYVKISFRNHVIAVHKQRFPYFLLSQNRKYMNQEPPKFKTESVPLPEDLAEWLRNYAFHKRMKKTAVIRQALSEFRDRIESESRHTPPIPAKGRKRTA
jgi:hypothetical protein